LESWKWEWHNFLSGFPSSKVMWLQVLSDSWIGPQTCWLLHCTINVNQNILYTYNVNISCQQCSTKRPFSWHHYNKQIQIKGKIECGIQTKCKQNVCQKCTTCFMLQNHHQVLLLLKYWERKKYVSNIKMLILTIETLMFYNM